MVERGASASSRQPWGARLGRPAGSQREAYLEGREVESLRRVVKAVEDSRYARPGSTLLDIREDGQRVVHAVSAVRRRRDRMRAIWLPQDGLAEWRERRSAVASVLMRPWAQPASVSTGATDPRDRGSGARARTLVGASRRAAGRATLRGSASPDPRRVVGRAHHHHCNDGQHGVEQDPHGGRARLQLLGEGGCGQRPGDREPGEAAPEDAPSTRHVHGSSCGPAAEANARCSGVTSRPARSAVWWSGWRASRRQHRPPQCAACRRPGAGGAPLR